jgi:DsbC/DsbD-like thiol-disulfide interchange protein
VPPSALRPFLTALLLLLPGTLPRAAAVQLELVPGPVQPSAEAQLVKVTLAADVSAAAAGSTFHLAVIFDIEPHWHIYWKSAGASGLPTDIEVEAPQGFTVGKVQFPRPMAFRDVAGTSFGYEGRAVMFVAIIAPPSVAESMAVFTVDMRWMACKGVCRMGQAQRSLALPVATTAAPLTGPLALELARHKARIPKPLRGEKNAAIHYEDGVLFLTCPAYGQTTAAFIPGENPGVSYDRAVITGGDQDSFQIAVKIDWQPQNALNQPLTLSGVITLGSGTDGPAFDFELMPIVP